MPLPRPRTPFRIVALLAVLGLVAGACAADGSTEPDDDGLAVAEGSEGDDGDDAPAEVADGPGLVVVATTGILGDVVEQLVQDDGEVTVLMGPGVDPHAYEPSAADAATLREADLVVANGLQLEESLVTALEAAEQEGVRVFTLADKLDPIEFDWDGPHDHGHAHDDDHAHEDEHDHAHDDDHGHDDDAHAHDDDHGHEDDDAHEDDHDHAHGPEDPHVWFDPIRMAEGVELLAAELAEVDERLDAAEWEARAGAYADELLAVHEELEERFAAIPEEHRYLVTNHDALGYLAHRYGFEVLGTVIPGATTQAETDPRQFAELIETVEEARVPAVFAENTDSTRLAEQLASEVVGRGDLDVEVVRIFTDALGEPGSGAETYLGLLRTTAERIADALG